MDVSDGERASKFLLLMPDGFAMMRTFFKEQANVHWQLYEKLNEMSSILEQAEERSCVVVGPTTDTIIPKKSCCRLAGALAEAARGGVKVIAAIELAKATATLAKKNIVSLVPAIESGKEPSHGPSARPRGTCAENYSKGVIKDYYEALRGYIKAEVELPPLEEKISRSARARNYFKDKKEYWSLLRFLNSRAVRFHLVSSLVELTVWLFTFDELATFYHIIWSSG
ncbi:unnamed protein product [Nippostrongylus brasiliensis]|uniref:Ribosomal_L7Ae domain-containing protein n=1 Tax=Nippostrongylus brasiliensis TaxID=27835 RepID=A0A0N4YN83_NIPBR|nr:unnamed protein product [Nippostrongylus brasiliensis]